MAVNCRYEISKLTRPEKERGGEDLWKPGRDAGLPDASQEDCTTAAILPDASRGGKTYAVKNWDFFQKIMDHIVLLRIRTGEYSVIGWTEAGQMPREGFNSYGVAIVNNGMQSVHDHYGAGLPVTFLRRRVLASKSFEEAAGLVKNFSRCVSNNIMLVGAKGQVLDFEVQPDRMDQVYSQGGILTHANHFVVQPEIHALQRSPRGDRLRELLMEKHGQIDVETIQCCMADHRNLPQSLCRHSNDPTQPVGMRTITVSSEIMDFEAGVMYVCSGSPCCEEYRAYLL